MQNVLTRPEQNLEVTLLVRLDLCDSFTVRAVDCKRGLVWLVGAVLSRLYNRAHGPDKNLSFHTAIGGSGFLDGAGGEQNYQNASDKLDSHRALLLYSV